MAVVITKRSSELGSLFHMKATHSSNTPEYRTPLQPHEGSSMPSKEPRTCGCVLHRLVRMQGISANCYRAARCLRAEHDIVSEISMLQQTIGRVYRGGTDSPTATSIGFAAASRAARWARYTPQNSAPRLAQDSSLRRTSKVLSTVSLCLVATLDARTNRRTYRVSAHAV
ncbi:hypothetical protein L227DRAFT_317730 [Lentinus tigrinus ALCF2SS1-6]|uniref:Uncharacterized protein n=1 Tax=Lentinus tigrinus ALCF2SS1-6 TaxID=1328759 RepID=A0A5C2SRU7_9APHY|nr:hypothetical protein L227DRAFT_317730 [Lentinus tigrinus ALCF2SS1-6]